VYTAIEFDRPAVDLDSNAASIQLRASSQGLFDLRFYFCGRNPTRKKENTENYTRKNNEQEDTPPIETGAVVEISVISILLIFRSPACPTGEESVYHLKYLACGVSPF
jgi:hypothetical protein